LEHKENRMHITPAEHPEGVTIVVPVALATAGVVLADQIKCLDWVSRGASYIAHAPEELVLELLRTLDLLLAG
jgi:mRNA-degrading endonuclease toxin of MazEF toxin-antitoxin module